MATTSRQMVSYDDITLPYDSSADCGRPPPPKKRKKNNQKARQVEKPPTTRLSAIEGDLGEYDEDESRELTREEIWDDSALVDAWEAAQQEYEMYHGTGKDWKNQPVKKSPLWQNVPVKEMNVSTARSSTVVAAQPDNIESEPDSQPLNFDTFVPTHDPSLNIDPPNYALGTPADSMVSQDEAFSRAMTAMYWGGYWTAMYHCQRSLSKPTSQNGVDDPEAEDETGEES